MREGEGLVGEGRFVRLSQPVSPENTVSSPAPSKPQKGLSLPLAREKT